MTCEEALLHPWITQAQSKENFFSRQNSLMNQLAELGAQSRSRQRVVHNSAAVAPRACTGGHLPGVVHGTTQASNNAKKLEHVMETVYRVLPSDSEDSDDDTIDEVSVVNINISPMSTTAPMSSRGKAMSF